MHLGKVLWFNNKGFTTSDLLVLLSQDGFIRVVYINGKSSVWSPIYRYIQKSNTYIFFLISVLEYYIFSGVIWKGENATWLTCFPLFNLRLIYSFGLTKALICLIDGIAYSVLYMSYMIQNAYYTFAFSLAGVNIYRRALGKVIN